jgi:hypothetical protein
MYVINVLDSCENIYYILVLILEILYAGAYTLLTNGLTGAFSFCILTCFCTTGGGVFICVRYVALGLSTKVLYFYIACCFCLQETYVGYQFILTNWFR